MSKTILALFLLIFLGLPVFSALAETDPIKSGTTDPNSKTETISLTNPLGITSVPGLIGRVINGVLTVVGSLALLMFIYGGFTWMLSGGNFTAVERGKNILIWASLGLVVIFISYALVNFVISTATGT